MPVRTGTDVNLGSAPDLGAVEVRQMREDDLDAVASVTEAAFCTVIEALYGRRVEPPLFASGLYSYRLAVDPAGCHVAVAEGQVVGANFSVSRGTLGWLGPIAVQPAAQGRRVAQALLRECLRSWGDRGVDLMGLETFPTSSLHINLYGKLGFQPAWTGIGFRRELSGRAAPAGVETDGAIPDLGYLLAGFDPAKEVRVTRATGAGMTFTCDRGFAICHLEQTLWNDPSAAYAPLVVAPDRTTFDRLMDAIEAAAAGHGKSLLLTQVPGSAVLTQQALNERGYRSGSASLRMKMGDHLDYDSGPSYYCDDWH